MRKKNCISAVIFLVCAVLAAVAHKAVGVYTDIRTQLDIIEENALNNVYGTENVLTNMERIHIDIEKSIGEYTFDYSWVEGQNLIAHAFGSIDGHDYTNSCEALALAYENGLRVIEGDMQLLDGRVVMMHDLGTAYMQSGLNEDELDYESFMTTKLFDEYTTMDIADVMEFMSEHTDVYFVTDSKYTSNPECANVISAMVIAAQKCDASVLDRVIVQIYNQKMLDTVMDIYPFKSVIYTLYMSEDYNNDVISFCLRTGVGAVTAHESRMTEAFCQELNAAGIKAFVHTINDLGEIKGFYDMGVTCVYTDTAVPSQTTK